MSEPGYLDIAATLEQIPLFSRLDRARLVLLGRASRIHEFPRGAAIYRQGETPQYLYVLLRGRVKVTRHISPGREFIVRVSAAPAALGEFAAFTARPHVLGAVGLEPCRVALIPCSTLRRTIDADASLTAELLNLLQECFEMVSAHIDVVAGAPVEQRLARLLVHLRASERHAVDHEPVIPLRLTREDLGALIGTTPETVVRVLTRWKSMGAVATRMDGIIVRGWDLIEHIALGEGDAHQRRRA